MTNAGKNNYPMKNKENSNKEWHEELSDGSASAFRETTEGDTPIDREISDLQLDKLLAESKKKNKPGSTSQAY